MKRVPLNDTKHGLTNMLPQAIETLLKHMDVILMGEIVTK